ncbi:MAG: xylulokinase, partial [Clostridia bacterium]|nr:xylulokinase [Clostridia bacterium]
DTAVRGVFAGLSMNTSREEMTLAVLEGVAFSLKENIEIIKSLGVDIHKSKICGGGTRNKFWVQLCADILGIDIEIPEFEHGGVLGACILAAQGCGNDISSAFYGIKETVHPDKAMNEFYEKKYAGYLKMYPLAKELK